MKLRFFLAFLIGVFLFSLYFFYSSYAFIFFVKDHQTINLTLKKHFFAPIQKELRIEIARTPTSVTQGLSKRTALQNVAGQKIDGLLFIFPEKAIRHFWMKDMQFALDICWLNNLNFFNCQREINFPEIGQTPESYSSPQAVNMVLETMPDFLSEEDLQLKLFFKWW